MTGFNSKREMAADKQVPAQEQRQPLTRQQCLQLAVHPLMTIEQVVRVVEAAHGIGDKE